MSEKAVKETVTGYTVPATRLVVPPEWGWLNVLSVEDRAAFFQELVDTIAAAGESDGWTRLTERIAAWKRRAERKERQMLAELRQQFIAEGGPSEIVSLLGKYRGRLSSVDEFIRYKQVEKSLER